MAPSVLQLVSSPRFLSEMPPCNVLSPFCAGSPLNKLNEAEVPNLDPVLAFHARNSPPPNLSNISKCLPVRGVRSNLVCEMPIRENEILAWPWRTPTGLSHADLATITNLECLVGPRALLTVCS
jgi:hypothetical protein